MRKILSLISCMLSVTIAVAFFAGAALFAMKFGGLKRIITDTADGLWGFDLIARAGLSVVLSVFGIAFSVCVGAFRITAAIYYYKAFRCGAVYKENKAWLLCYSFCAFVMVLLFAFAATGGTV
ncbi:MAG TPA: hypothetical protein DDW54_00955, partial [Clostridiales bacterium]|nr:hypothetical protein [Clostridiales bacterium]